MKRTDLASPLHSLEGLTVTAIVTPHDYVQLQFGDQIGISVYNAVTVLPKTQNIRKLVGKTVSSIIEGKNGIEIKFIDDTCLIIDMRPDAYRGPEALELHRYGQPLVVWN